MKRKTKSILYILIAAILTIGAFIYFMKDTLTYKYSSSKIFKDAYTYRYDDYNIDIFEDAMNIINIKHVNKIKSDELTQIVFEVADQISYLPDSVYKTLKDNDLTIYLTDDVSKCFEAVMECEDDGTSAGLFTVTIDEKPIIILGTDFIQHALYHEIGHAYDLLKQPLEERIYISDSEEFLKVYEEEKDNSLWMDMDNKEYYIDTSTEYFAESFKNYCLSLYFGEDTYTEFVDSTPKTVEFIKDSLK